MMNMRTGSLLGAFFSGVVLFPTALACEPVKAAEPETRVNINTADAATLALRLKGVGQAKAEAIVRWRSEKGKFTSLQQLDKVKGFGPALIDSNRDRIVFQD
ncbi:MAG TPA: ComEA family DNA-binding protein [Fluviicoccus sp.]|nr:ComEA family DNA-binding protein [Fluviicoccus sp.]